MSSHWGLPKNIPQNKVRGRIFSPNVSPCKSVTSPCGDSASRSSLSKTSEKSVSLSQHKLRFKEKPIHLNPMSGIKQKRVDQQTINVGNFDESELENSFKNIEKHNNQEFVQTVLGMMGGLAKSNQEPPKKQITIKPKYNQNKTIHALQPQQNSSSPPAQQKNQIISECSTTSQIETAQEMVKPTYSNQQILSKCENLLENKNNWKIYKGEESINGQDGFAIAYFTNGDKFMGAFTNGKANGHGTYYDYTTGKRMMGVWTKNRANLEECILEEM